MITALKDYISIKKVCHFHRAGVEMSVARKRNLLLCVIRNCVSKKTPPHASFEMTAFFSVSLRFIRIIFILPCLNNIEQVNLEIIEVFKKEIFWIGGDKVSICQGQK